MGLVTDKSNFAVFIEKVGAVFDLFLSHLQNVDHNKGTLFLCDQRRRRERKARTDFWLSKNFCGIRKKIMKNILLFL